MNRAETQPAEPLAGSLAEPRVILCAPRHPFSSTFALEGDGSEAELRFGWVTETGEIAANGRSFTVAKRGAMSGSWVIEEEGHAVAEAKKTSPLTRTFVVDGPMGSLALSASSPWRRAFSVEGEAGEHIATITPDHAFTRRSSIRLFVEDYHWPTVCFLFWLAVMAWRRDEAG